MTQASGAYKQYTQAKVNTTDQSKLILMVYDFAIKNCYMAMECIENDKIEERANKIYKVQDCVTELMVALNMDSEGDIAKNLYRLYEYFNYRLTQANIKNDATMVKEILTHLKELRETWAEAFNSLKNTNSLPADDAGSKNISATG
jgi:flagellar secretion chaperone FliS